MTVTMFGLGSAAQVLKDHTHDQADQPPPQTAPKKPAKRGPRAIAVLEFLPGGGARLVPVALWIDDRFYDASLYGADPEPMALQPETVYEATDYGEPTGLFTVTTPEQVKGSWVGTGQWRPQFAIDQQRAQQAAKKSKQVTVSNPADDRPTLHRAGSSGSNNSAASGGTQSGSSSGNTNSSAGNSTPDSPEPPDRPVLKRPASEDSTASSTPASTPTASAPSNGSGSASGTTSSSTSAATAVSPDESDPNRAVLRRGKPTGQQAASQAANPVVAQAATATSATQAAQAKLMNTMAHAGRHSYPAVSDAGTYDTRSLLYVMNASEREDKAEQMRGLAMDAIRQFVAKRTTPGLPKAAHITDYDLRAFDLEYSNSPTLVFTGTLPVETAKALRGGDFNYFVTVVACEDVNGDPIKIFSSVSDSNHLDAFPRMEIIDAVDADANGRGDLLFRQYSDVGISYSLYRVFPYDMQKVFEGGSGM